MRLPFLTTLTLALLGIPLQALSPQGESRPSKPTNPLPAGALPTSATPATPAAAPKAAASAAERSRRIFGQVVDDDGQPIAGVGVVLGSLKTLVTENCLTSPIARTDAEGHFEFILDPPVLPKPEKPAATPDAKTGSSPVAPPDAGSDAGSGVRTEIAGEIVDALPNAEVAATQAEERAEAAARIAAETEEILGQRRYLLVCGEGRLARRVTMPKVSHKVVKTWKKPVTRKEKVAKVGFDILARIWGRPAKIEKDGVDLGKISLGRGLAITGRARDASGNPVVGARVTARDLLTAGRFRGVTKPSKTYHYSYATTGEDGGFTLPGVFPTGSQITVTAEGYFDFTRPVAGAASGLDVTLAPSVRVEGRVVGQDDKPANASVQVRYEVASTTHTVKVTKDGKFSYFAKFPHRMRLYVKPTGESAKKHKATYSELISRGQKDFVVRLDEKVAKPKTEKPKKKKLRGRWARAAERGFPVTIIDKLTRQPLRDFKASAVWVRANYVAVPYYYVSRGRTRGKTSKQPGYIRIPGPKNETTPKGAVVVTAPGYATTATPELEFSPGKVPDIAVELVPESILSGVVRGTGNGDVVPSANVYLYPVSPDGRSSRVLTTCRSDKQGRFTFRGLSAGRYRLTVIHKRVTSNPLIVDLASEEKRGDLILHSRLAPKLSGKVTGVTPRKGWLVELLNENVLQSMLYNPGYRPSGLKTALKEDGTFEFQSVPVGYYEVCLHIPRSERRETALQIPIEPVRVRNRDQSILVDASEDRTGKLRGTVKLTGARIDRSRLLVTVTRYVPTNPYNYYGNSNVDLSGVRSPLSADGKFEVEVPSGKHRIKVFDVITGVLLYQTESAIRVESDETTLEDVEVALTELTVKIKPTKEGGGITAAWLNIDVEQPKPEALQMFVFSSGSSGRKAAGVSLVGQTDVVRLVLPPYKTRLQVFSEVARLARTKQKPRSILGEAEVTLKLGEKNAVDIEVEVPTTGLDPEPDPEKPNPEKPVPDKSGKKAADEKPEKKPAPAADKKKLEPGAEARK